MTRRAIFLKRIDRDTRGATIVEFALVIPVLLLGIMGFTELCYRLYAQSVLEGAVQKAARDSSIQGADAAAVDAAIDQNVINMVQSVVPSATFNAVSDRRANYDNYSAIAPEPFVDAAYNGQPADGVCDHGESFTDINANGTWDTDPGVSGQGGASDMTRYRMTATYTSLFPLFRFAGWPATQTVSATTILRNQPYANQSTTTAKTGTCP